MPKISLEDCEKLSKLACIKIKSMSLEAIRQDVESIITFMSTLKSVDTNNVMPLFHPIEYDAPLREDLASDSNLVINEQFYISPKVLVSD